jgi:PEP-CTERM motif
MKKLILSVTALAACSVGAYAQGTITFNGQHNSNNSPTAPSGGQVFLNGVLDTTQDINAELLYSSTGAAGTFSPVVTLLLSSTASASTPALGQISGAAGDVLNFPGHLTDPSGNTYQFNAPNAIAAGTVAFFEVEGWTGTSSTLPAPGGNVYVGVTGVFSETLTSATAQPQAGIDQMPALNLVSVPEPTTLAMAGVGLASMLIFRRKVS